MTIPEPVTSGGGPGDHPLKLHVGCGEVYLAGWVNIDWDSPTADLTIDIRGGLPYPDGTVAFIYAEHVIEHFTVDEGLAILRDFHRVLAPDGVARIATPDLRFLARRYFLGWRRQEWITRYAYEWIQTRAEMMNIALREWGHQYIYDGEELARRLREAGFSTLRRVRVGRSAHPALQRIETRRDSTLIMEATRDRRVQTRR